MTHREKEADSSELREATEAHTHERGQGAVERNGHADPVATLHRSVGNQGVQKLGKEGVVQPKLKASSSSEPAEREAEKIAEEVTSQRQPSGVTADSTKDRVSSPRTATSVREYSPKQARKQQRRDEAQIVDVRSPSEFRRGHVPGAKNIPASKISQRANEIEEGKEIVLCCQTGRRSKQIARQLSSSVGLTVRNLRDGYEAWENGSSDRDETLSEPLPVPYEAPDATSDHSDDESELQMTKPECWDSSWAPFQWHKGEMSIVNRDYCCTRECTQRHEQRHIEDLENCFKKAAKAFNEADRKLTVKNRWRQWYNNEGMRDWTECNAYEEGVRCTRQLWSNHNCESRNQSSECCYAIDYSLNFAEFQLRRYCSSAPSSPPTCPF